MKSIKHFLWIFPVFFIFSPASSLSAAEDDIIKQWIKEDMEEKAVERMEELAAQRERTKLDSVKFQIIQLYGEARGLLELKEYNEAREKYRKILTLDPGESKAGEYIAKIERIQEISRQKRLKREITQKEKERIEKFRQFAREGAELYRDKKYSKAKKNWEEALKYDPDNAGIKEWIRRARLQEVKEAEKEILFEKDLEERTALAAVDNAYIPKSRMKEKRARGEEPGVVKEEKRKKIEELLDKTVIQELHLRNVDLREFIDRIASMTRITILVNWPAISKATGVSVAAPVISEEGEGEAGVTSQAESRAIRTLNLGIDIYPSTPLTLRDVLDYLVDTTGLKYIVKENAILISTPQAMAKEETVLKIYTLKYGMTKLRPVTLAPLGEEED